MLRNGPDWGTVISTPAPRPDPPVGWLGLSTPSSCGGLGCDDRSKMPSLLHCRRRPTQWRSRQPPAVPRSHGAWGKGWRCRIDHRDYWTQDMGSIWRISTELRNQIPATVPTDRGSWRVDGPAHLTRHRTTPFMTTLFHRYSSPIIPYFSPSEDRIPPGA